MNKSFKFITLPLIMAMFLSIAYSAFKENGGEWDAGKLLDYIPFFSSFSQPQPKTKVVYYFPNAQPQNVYIGDGKWNFRIASSGYYEIPKYGLTRARNTDVPVTGKKCWDASILPYKNVNYYGGILVNSLPNSSVVKSDNRGCVKISLNLPKEIKEVKASKKTKLVFTSAS
ncbi:hypothetical protein J7J13_00795 [bacterium]|nr:hypothetical protein [bacterium]